VNHFWSCWTVRVFIAILLILESRLRRFTPNLNTTLLSRLRTECNMLRNYITLSVSHWSSPSNFTTKFEVCIVNFLLLEVLYFFQSLCLCFSKLSFLNLLFECFAVLLGSLLSFNIFHLFLLLNIYPLVRQKRISDITLMQVVLLDTTQVNGLIRRVK
jgi:hypothetical protein